MLLYDIDGIEQYIAEFKAEREDKVPQGNRTYGYVKKNRLDSVETELLSVISNQIKEAQELMKNRQTLEASGKIQEIFDQIFQDFDLQVQQDADLAGYNIEIIPMLRSGMSDFILNTPGNVQMRDVTAAGIHGNPTTYTMEGKQYVAIVYGAGGGGIWPLYYANFLKTHTKGGGLMVFSVN